MNSMVERPLKKTTLVVAIVVKKRTLGQISFIMQKQTDNPVLSMISCTVQKQIVQKCSKKQMAVVKMKDMQRFQRVCPKNESCDQQKPFFQQIKTSNTNK